MTPKHPRALKGPTPMAMSLEELAEAGYCTDEWARWQQGGCGYYAVALVELRPDLQGASIDGGGHYYAHDDQWAYDSAGRHPMPYTGIGGYWDWPTDTVTGMDYDELSGEVLWGWGKDDREIEAAKEHIRRNSILQGRYGAHTASAKAA